MDLLDVSVAALAGLSVAFLAFAAPADRMADLIGLIGLAAVLPMAEPLIGAGARVVAGGAGAVVTFALAWLLLRWLGRFGRPLEQPELLLETVLAVEAEAPRRRRVDLRTDALERPALPDGPPPPTGSNIPDLMERLEQGLARLRAAAREAPPAGPHLAPATDDDRLQGAIENLRRLAAGRN